MNRLHPSPESRKSLRGLPGTSERSARRIPTSCRRRVARHGNDPARLDRASLSRLSTAELWSRFAEGADRTSLDDLRRVRDVIQLRYFSLIPDLCQRPLAG